MKYAKIYRASAGRINESILNHISTWDFSSDTLLVDDIPFEKAVIRIEIWDDLGGFGDAKIDDSGPSYSGPASTTAIEYKGMIVLVVIQYGEDFAPTLAERNSTITDDWFIRMMAVDNPKDIKYCAERVSTIGGWFTEELRERIVHLCDVWISLQSFKGIEDYETWPYVQTQSKGVENYDTWPYVSVTSKGSENYDTWPYVSVTSKGSENYDTWPYVQTVNYGVEYYTDFPT